ncbi:Protein kinase superfamily protein [Raphanus sativus]|uniref:Cold-responsive protein kinase 1 n=1 Tax=Raphanus sativus TaxID=3726 RepID=A0A6J0K304_RAPSA|nr:cold-responsive protein kinase 1 [Raphanus sativus]XP_056864364.1 cold-responsive protein kinase 1 [Raphanus sativus]KAJ4915970.1 Protein kinase superfamily protein [Raphanus sativus]
MGCSWFSRHKSGGRLSEVDDGGITSIQNVKIYKYKEIRQATDDFNPLNKIGEGGFGSVYKGHLKDGKMAAIKILSAESRQGVKEFLTEINVISKIQHENLVKLYGCCVEGNHRILVYNYLENNSLDKTLLAGGYTRSGIQFDWRTRAKICIGVAKGLAFLHEEVRPHIIHRDIKASNILLDKDLSPKISDFGLARLMPPNMTHVSTRVAGTIGYLAPEYAVRGQLTRKADIYSYGVLLMEIVSARSNKNTRLPTEYQYLLERAWELYERNELVDLVDTGLNGDFDAEEACRYLKIGLLCTQDSPKLRPTMSTVVKLLTGEKDIDTRRITRPGLISDFMDLKVRGPVETKPDEVNRNNNNYTDPSSYNASSSSGTRDNSNAFSSGASSANHAVSSFNSTI